MKITSCCVILVKGYFRLALKVCTLIIHRFVESKGLQSLLQARETFTSQFHSESFIRSLHATRQGNLSYDDSSFRDIVYPAFFAAYLGHPFELVTGILTRGIAMHERMIMFYIHISDTYLINFVLRTADLSNLFGLEN